MLTPVRHTRIPDAEWLPAQRIAEQRGESVTDVIRAALRRYVKRHSR